MSTTSLKLSEELKQRAVAAAERKGVSPHAFMVNAIEQAATAAELRASFVGEALVAREQMVSTRKGYDSREVHTYLKARISGNKSAKPKAKSWQSMRRSRASVPEARSRIRPRPPRRLD